MTTPTSDSYSKHKHEIETLSRIAITIGAHIGSTELISEILNLLVAHFNWAYAGCVVLSDQFSDFFRLAALAGYDPAKLNDIKIAIEDSIIEEAYHKGDLVVARYIGQSKRTLFDMLLKSDEISNRSPRRSSIPDFALAMPIMLDNQTIGVLFIEGNDNSPESIDQDFFFLQIVSKIFANLIIQAQTRTKFESYRELEHTEGLQSETSLTLSHELRMPLTAIKGYSSALMMEEVEWSEEKRNHFLHLINEECDTIQTILTDLLDSSLIEKDQLSIERQPIRIYQLANDVVSEMQLQSETHRFVVDIAREFPIVEADHLWIKQVFRNLLDNAVKYSPDGGLVMIRGEARSEDVVISIADQGIGISPEDLLQLFDKYYRVLPLDSSNIPGMGLGLPIARTVIEAHGGRIWVDSKEGQGTIISFTLPRMKVPNND
ncbi:MAG: ATP-binding protein [Anaerolineales bacterium]|jgi:K+-sensing histidine kinase KdpD